MSCLMTNMVYSQNRNLTVIWQSATILLMTRIRIWKYALHPTPIQRVALKNAGVKSKILWNRLVKETFWAIRECENGRRANVVNEYIKLLQTKKLVGQRAVQVKKISSDQGISSHDALKKFISEKVSKDTTIIIRKDGTRALRWSNRHLARLYAVEYVNRLAPHILKHGTSQIWHGIANKWNDFCNSWEKGIFDKPRIKKYNQISAIQKQIGKTSIFEWDGNTVNLSWLGSLCLETVVVAKDRPIPKDSKIIQIAVVKSPTNQWFVCLFLEADEKIFIRHFTTTGKVVGIDPGMKAALTTSEGEVIHPKGLSRDSKLERRIKKLSRKLDRQTRACNPHCFDENGAWKRGQKITVRSKGMLTTTLEIASIKQHFSDARADYYHTSAIKLLNQFDVIGIGNAKMHTLIRGNGKSKRGQNRIAREHAISDFVSKLKDKASLSLTSKQVFDKVSEINTTRKCSDCGELSGPTGINDLNVRQWKCEQCGASHDRDVNAAKNIRSNTISEMKATASQAVSETKVSKVRRSTKGKIAERSRPRSTETITSQDDGPMSIPVASAQVVAQTSTDARILYLPVTERVTKVISSVDSASPSEMMGHSKCQEDNVTA